MDTLRETVLAEGLRSCRPAFCIRFPAYQPTPSPPFQPVQVLLVAELEELQANPLRAARGTVLEASLDRKAGAVCSLLVQVGTLKVGDAVQAGSAYGKVRGGLLLVGMEWGGALGSACQTALHWC